MIDTHTEREGMIDRERETEEIPGTVFCFVGPSLYFLLPTPV